ncbi:hypothetical protein PN836_006340 [Ningiella sp. W23]|uniref:hypothetical protein n=1 Tax=Ningiella sp. W23 TaxID=3023715 RepID=UPI0037584893
MNINYQRSLFAKRKCSSLLLLISMVLSFTAYAQDRNKEVDVAYGKLLTYLPENAQLIHVPYADKLEYYGSNIVSERFEDEDVTGGKLLRLNVLKASKNPWDDAVTAGVGGEIKKGDTVYMMFWGRIAPDDPKNDQVSLPDAGLQKGAPPYNKLMSDNIILTRGWQTFAMAGVADQDYGAYGTQISFPVSTGAHIIDFGPVFIFNLGKDIDIKSLPFMN